MASTLVKVDSQHTIQKEIKNVLTLYNSTYYYENVI